MLHYTLARAIQQIYNIDVFITERMFRKLEMYFQLVDPLPIAEYSLCGFEKFFKLYMTEYRRKMLSTVEEETARRKRRKEEIFKSENYDNFGGSSDLTSVLHSPALYTTQYGVTDDMR